MTDSIINSDETADAQALSALCFHEVFEQRVEGNSSKTALEFDEENNDSAVKRLSYRELNESANRLARHLKSFEIKPDELVGVCLDRSLDLVVSFLSILKSGGVYLPIDPSLPDERIQFMLKDSGIQVLVTDNEKSSRFRDSAKNIIRVDSDRDIIEKHDSKNLEKTANSQNLAYCIYTSGSTGIPKGALLHHEGLVNLAGFQRRIFELDCRSKVLQFSSLSFDASVWEFAMALGSGACLSLAKSKSLLPGNDLSAVLRRRAITHVTLPPSALRVMPNDDFPDLQMIVSAGEACHADLVKRWAKGRSFFNAYGPTETTVCATITKCSSNGEAPTIGRAIDNFEVHILDESLSPVPLGEKGELCVAGVGVARGYLNRETLTKERFVINEIPNTSYSRLYRTGDLARYLPDGNIEFLGRIDDQIKLRGYRIELGEIEAVILSHPSVLQCAVVVQRFGEDNENSKLVAFFRSDEMHCSIEHLRNFLESRLPDYMMPAHFIELDSFPLNSSGKIDRSSLAESGNNEFFANAEQNGYTPLENRIARAWCECLGVKSVGRDDDFFELGGDSITATKVVNRLQEMVQGNLHLSTIFDAPTVASFANFLADRYEFVNSHCSNGVENSNSKRENPITIIAEKIRTVLSNETFSAREDSTFENRTVFILSPGRSGSTLLRVILAGHPALFSPPELFLLSFETLKERQDCLQGRFSLFDKGLHLAMKTLLKKEDDAIIELVNDSLSEDLCVRDIYELLFCELGERVLVDKTPSYCFHSAVLERMESEFKDPLYIHLLRHPSATIQSMSEFRLDVLLGLSELDSLSGVSNEEISNGVWQIGQRNIINFLKKIPTERQMALRFENLILDPLSEIKKVCDFIDVDFVESMLDPYGMSPDRMINGFGDSDEVFGDPKFRLYNKIDASVANKWKSSLPTIALLDETRVMAKELGYFDL